MNLFCNVDAQALCVKFAAEGGQVLSEVIAQENGSERTRLAACAIVSNLLTNRMPERWSFAAHQYIAQSSFYPDDDLVMAAQEFAGQVNTVLPGFIESFKFKKNFPKKKTKKPIRINMKKLKKSLRQRHGTENVDVVRDDDGVMIFISGTPQIADAIDIGYLNDKCSLEIDISSSLPSDKEADSLRAILLNVEKTASSIGLNTGSSGKPKRSRDPNRVLLKCINELKALKALSVFESSRIYIDDDITKALVQSGKLEIFCVDSEFEVEVSRRIVPLLLACKDLRRVRINSKSFRPKDASLLLEAKPGLMVEIGDFQSGF